MPQNPRRARIRLELTPEQKEQIREATGREVSALELRLQALPEPADRPGCSRVAPASEPRP